MKQNFDWSAKNLLKNGVEIFILFIAQQASNRLKQNFTTKRTFFKYDITVIQ